MDESRFGNVSLSVRCAEAVVAVNLDSDGTPLSRHGERMIEIEPGKWADPLVAEVIEFYARCAADGTLDR